MVVTYNGYEYSRYGENFVRRPAGSTDDWETLNPDPEYMPHDQDEPRPIPREALIEVEVAERMRQRRIEEGPRQRRVIITRSPENIAIGEEFGFTGGESMQPTNASANRNAGDTLAQRLNDDKRNGTNKRVTELRFQQIAEKLGMAVDELRSRFRGDFNRE